MSNASTLTPAEAGTAKADLRDALIPHLRASILPGDTPLSEEALGQTAELLVSAGFERQSGSEALLLESTTTGRRTLRIGIVNEDMPFLVDSVAAAINAMGLSIDVLVHPLVPIMRDAQGQLTAIGTPDAPMESMIYIETPRVDARQRRELLTRLRVILADVRAAVSDWRAIQAIMETDADALERAQGPNSREEAHLLRWLNGGMLTQLGHVTRRRDGTLSEVLGICRESARDLLADSSYDRAFAWFEQPDADGRQRTLLILKANRMSNVHRCAALDLFLVPRREGGNITALSVHAGVWTSAALATASHEVPVLRGRLAALTSEYSLSAKSHTGKALIHAFTTLPYDLLIGFSALDTRRLITSVMSLVDRPRPRLILVSSPLERHIYAFVWLPRDQLSTAVVSSPLEHSG
ncbi:MAG: hypothetical protein AAFQ13_04090 [Pseudomonadota bacterium]